MPEGAIRVGAAALGLVFAWAAAAKVMSPAKWRAALAGYDLPQGLRRIATVSVPIAEVAVAGFILAGRTRAGAALAIALLAGFSAVVVRAHARKGDRLPCGCFGGAAERDYRVMLGRNALIGVVAASILLNRLDVGVFDGWSTPAPADALPIVLIVVGVGLGAWVLRQVAGSFRQGDRG